MASISSQVTATPDIKMWTKEAAEDDYVQAAINNWVNLLSMILTGRGRPTLDPRQPHPQAEIASHTGGARG